MPMLIRQAVLLEGEVSARELAAALKSCAPAFTGPVLRFERKAPLATWVRLSAFEESSRAGPPLSEAELSGLARRLAKQRRVWAVEALAGTTSSVQVIAIDATGSERWASRSASDKPLARAQAELLQSRRPLEFDLSFDDLLTPESPWGKEEEVALETKGSGKATLAQLSGPLKYADREAAIINFVRARGLKATDDRSREEARLLERAVSSLKRQSGGWACEPLVLRDKQTGLATGEALLFGPGFSLWHYTTTAGHPQKRKRSATRKK